jgi:hypothetical protein
LREKRRVIDHPDQARRWSSEPRGSEWSNQIHMGTRWYRDLQSSHEKREDGCEVQRYVNLVSGALLKAAERSPIKSYHHAVPSEDHCFVGLFPSEDQPFQADRVCVISSKVLVDGLGSSGGSVRVQDLRSIGALVAVKARDGVLDLVDDRLVVAGSSRGGVAGQARYLVVDRLTSRLVVVGLEVSVMDGQKCCDDESR